MELKEILAELVSDCNSQNRSYDLEEILDYYADYIVDKASEQKWINAQVQDTIKDYPANGTTQEQVDFYVNLKDKKSILEAKIASMQEVLKQIDNDLLTFLEQNPTDRLTSSDGHYISPRTRINFSAVQSDVKLVKEALKDQWEEFEGFNTKRMNALIKDYKGMSDRLDVPLEDLLPRGIVVTKNTYLTVRKPGKGPAKESTFDIMSLINSNEGEE